MRRPILVQCPACEFVLHGSAHEGFRCARCHASYSIAFVRRLRREQLRSMIEHHFGIGARAPERPAAKRVEIQESTVIFAQDDADAAPAADETKAAPQERPQELLGDEQDEFVDLSALVKSAQPQTQNIAAFEERPELHPHDPRLDQRAPEYSVEDLIADAAPPRALAFETLSRAATSRQARKPHAKRPLRAKPTKKTRRAKAKKVARTRKAAPVRRKPRVSGKRRASRRR
jgi:hypothetical protein